jgi:hypothetical protein
MLSNKRVLVNGCSFTAQSKIKNWPQYLPAEWTIKNIAQHAAGNKWICDATIVETIKNEYDLVLIMWSGLTRIDATVNATIWDQFWEFKSKNSIEILYGHCGIGDSPEHPMVDISKPLIKYSNERNLVFASLMNVLKLQAWLTSKNIKYRFMSYMNYWNNDYIDNKLMQPSVNLNLEALVNQIDFSQWIFFDSEKNGIFELAQQQNLYADDGVHPNDRAGNLWSNIVLESLNA